MKPKTFNQAAMNVMTKARTTLLIDHPFFGTLVMRLKFIEDGSIPTLNVDGKHVRYNPEFMIAQKSEIAVAALAHEVMHCVLNHCGSQGRGINLDPAKWGHAADYATNEILKQSGFTLGEGWLYDPKFAGMSAEHIYKLIPTPPPQPHQAPNKGAPGPLDTHSAGDPDPSAAAQEAAEWKMATVQAANAAKAAGKLSGGLEQFVEQFKKSKVDWRSELREFLVRAAKNDYAWQKPNRKMLAAGFILPGMYSEDMGGVVVAADESGSVDKAITEAFAAETAAIIQDLRPEKTTLMHFDSDVRKVEEFSPDDAFKMTRFCCGGTDFRPAIKMAEEMADPPMCMIFLTDLYGPFPDYEPPFPVLWVSINDQKAPFGQTLHIEV